MLNIYLKSVQDLSLNQFFFSNPTPAGSDFIWSPATKENRECLVISDELKMMSKLYRKRIKFWDDFIEKYKKMAVNGVVKNVRDEL